MASPWSWTRGPSRNTPNCASRGNTGGFIRCLNVVLVVYLCRSINVPVTAQDVQANTPFSDLERRIGTSAERASLARLGRYGLITCGPAVSNLRMGKA